VFQANKNTCQVVPPYSWTATHGTLNHGDPVPNVKAELQALGPLEPLPLLDGFEFERDYLGEELKEIQERKIDAPKYRIKMKLGTL
jgi:hypothetical protein